MAPAYIKTHLFKVALSLVVKFSLYPYLVCFNIVMRFWSLYVKKRNIKTDVYIVQ